MNKGRIILPFFIGTNRVELKDLGALITALVGSGGLGVIFKSIYDGNNQRRRVEIEAAVKEIEVKRLSNEIYETIIKQAKAELKDSYAEKTELRELADELRGAIARGEEEIKARDVKIDQKDQEIVSLTRQVRTLEIKIADNQRESDKRIRTMEAIVKDVKARLETVEREKAVLVQERDEYRDRLQRYEEVLNSVEEE